MSTVDNLPIFAFFGATGGVTNSALVHALRSKQRCVALARDPSKLRKQLLEQGLDDQNLDALLTIISGDATKVEDVKRTLHAGNTSHLVSHIVTGVGAAPSVFFNLKNPLNFISIDQPHLCRDAAQSVLAALQDIYNESPQLKKSKPGVTFISTTGISKPRGPDDVPFAMRFLYHQMLAEPHVDKREMEELYRGNMEEKDEGSILFSYVTGVRPTLLKGTANADDADGLAKVRTGTESAPAMGYGIKRADVGHWVWVNVLEDEKLRQKWANEMVTLTL